MRNFFAFIVFCVLFCTPGPILAQPFSIDDFSDCGALGSANEASSNKVGQNGTLCFDFDSGFGVADSDPVEVQANRASMCLDADRTSTGGAAVVDVQVCGVDAAGDNTCVDTGLTLSAANPCEAFVRGRYRFEVTTAPTGTQDAQIVIRGY